MVKYASVINMSNKIRGSLMLLLATVIWGSAFVSQSVAMDYMEPFSFQAIRCFLAFMIMLPIICFFDRSKKDGKNYLLRWKDKTLWKAGLLCGIPLFLACNLQQLALVDTDAGKSGFLTAMYIVFVPLIGLFRKRRLSALMPLSIALAVVGLYLLSCVGVTSIQSGDILLLMCAVMFAVQINVVDHYANRVDPLRLNAVQILICTILSAAVMLLKESPTVSGIIHCLPQLAHVGFLSMGVAYGLQILGQTKIAQAPAALLMSLESVFALIFGMLFLKETLNAWEILGCVLIFAAVILSQIELPAKKTQRVP